MGSEVEVPFDLPATSAKAPFRKEALIAFEHVCHFENPRFRISAIHKIATAITTTRSTATRILGR
jgi:hypothetical protein